MADLSAEGFLCRRCSYTLYAQAWLDPAQKRFSITFGISSTQEAPTGFQLLGLLTRARGSKCRVSAGCGEIRPRFWSAMGEGEAC